AASVDRLDHARAGELGESLRQKVRRDPRQAVEKLPVAARAEQQIAHDEDRPAVADDVQRLGNSAELVIAPARRHRACFYDSKYYVICKLHHRRPPWRRPSSRSPPSASPAWRWPWPRSSSWRSPPPPPRASPA